jgi:sugar phosphate isomerase/epimerase
MGVYRSLCCNRDDHLACGEGNIDLRRVLAAVPAGATKVVEPVSFQQFEQSLDYLGRLTP